MKGRLVSGLIESIASISINNPSNDGDSDFDWGGIGKDSFIGVSKEDRRLASLCTEMAYSEPLLGLS